MANHPYQEREQSPEEAGMRNAWRRWHGPHRPTSEADISAAGDSEKLAALIDSVHQLRLTLAADLATAASAIEADELEVARDIVAADSLEVRRLTDAMPVQRRPQPARRRRALLALPAIPLVGALAMTGAAAFTAGGSASSPSAARHSVSVPAIRETPRRMSDTATTTLKQLERVLGRHSKSSQVVALAADLHDQLTEIIASSANDPTRLGEVQQLLSAEQQLLEGQRGEAVAVALAASRKLTHLLLDGKLPTLHPSSVLPTIIAVTKPPSKKPTPTRSSTPTQPASKPTPSAQTPSANPSPSRTSHQHHHHSQLPTPFGDGLDAGGL